MRITWSQGTTPALDLAVEPRLSELYHENSKLFPELARQQADRMQASPFELFITSRGFRQYRNAPRLTLPEVEAPVASLTDVMLRRRSRRELSGRLTLAAVAALLRQALGPNAVVANEQLGVVQTLRAWPSAGGLYPLDTYLVANRVADFPAGLYHYNPIAGDLELLPARSPELVLRDGFFWQDFVITGALTLLLVASFERTLAKYGERGYRLVLLDAGHAAQNVLLTAEQLELGAVAVGGFCDDSLAEDLGIDGISEAVVHAIVIGAKP